MLLRFADITIALLSADPGLKLQVAGPEAKFLVRDGAPTVTIRTCFGDTAACGTGALIFDAGSLWQLFARNGGYCFRFSSPVLGSGPYKTASFNADFTLGEVLLARDCFPSGQTLYPLEYPLDELLLVNLLAAGRGVEVHGCGIIDGTGQGRLFVGHSGAGKTTVARLFQGVEGVEILSDDRVILRLLNGRPWIYGTPWQGDAGLASPARAPLAGIYFLRHAPTSELIPQSAAESVRRLITCSFLPFYRPDALDFTLGLFEAVVTTVACNELRFVPDASVLERVGYN